MTGAVDGNLIRVLCRLRAIGADSTSPAVTEALWWDQTSNYYFFSGHPKMFSSQQEESNKDAGKK